MITIREQNVFYFHQKWYQNSCFGSVLTYQIKPSSSSSSPAVWRLTAELLALLGGGSGLSLLICTCTALIKSICEEKCSIFVMSKRSACNHHYEIYQWAGVFMSDREAENKSFATSGVLSLKTLVAGYNESILKVCVCVCVCGYPTEPEDVCQCTQHQQVCICAVCTHTHTHKSENKIWCIYTHI